MGCLATCADFFDAQTGLQNSHGVFPWLFAESG